MATLGASMVTLLTDNWAGAGAAPTFGFLIDYRKELADTTEQVLVRLPIHEDVDPINDILSNFKFTMQLRVKTTVSEDRLKVLTDETIRIINTYAITGITRQFAKRGENTSDRKMQVFSYDVWATLEEHASTAGTSYSSPGAGDVVFPADVDITGDLDVDNIVASGSITIRPSGDTDDYFTFGTSANQPKLSVIGADLYLDDDVTVTGTLDVSGVTSFNDESITSTQIADLLMFGSANATWVPCIFEDGQLQAYYELTALGHFSNVGADAMRLFFIVPYPSTMGSLKLYISGVEIGLLDADATNYVTDTYVWGLTYNAFTELDRNTTNLTTIAAHQDTFTAVDCSGYDRVTINVRGINPDNDALDVSYVKARCYYAA